MTFSENIFLIPFYLWLLLLRFISTWFPFILFKFFKVQNRRIIKEIVFIANYVITLKFFFDYLQNIRRKFLKYRYQRSPKISSSYGDCVCVNWCLTVADNQLDTCFQHSTYLSLNRKVFYCACQVFVLWPPSWISFAEGYSYK